MKKSELIVENVLMKMLKKYDSFELSHSKGGSLSGSTDRFIEDALKIVREMEESGKE